MKSRITILLSAIFFLVISCEKNTPEAVIPVHDDPVSMDISSFSKSSNFKSTAADAPENLAVLMAEYLTVAESGEIGRTVYFLDVGNKKLTADFVPGLALDGTNDVSFYIDETRPSTDLPVAATSGAIQSAMATWDGVTCSELGMFQVPSLSIIETGFIAAILGYGGSFNYVADVVHCGWLSGDFFDLIAEDGSTYILGVTFTIIFINDDGSPSDIDNNKKADVAFREIYYNDEFPWAIDNHYDVETIALHEAGHGLSQGHFGKAFRTVKNGKLHFAPRALMNAAYSGLQTTIEHTDNAGHCSIWANWPQN